MRFYKKKLPLRVSRDTLIAFYSVIHSLQASGSHPQSHQVNDEDEDGLVFTDAWAEGVLEKYLEAREEGIHRDDMAEKAFNVSYGKKHGEFSWLTV